MKFKDLKNQPIKLYAGTIYDRDNKYDNLIGLSLDLDDDRHIKFDISQVFPLPDNSIDSFFAEDVLEHIPVSKIQSILNEIFRILKPNGYFRIAVPDYNCDILYKRCLYDYKGNIVYDPGGGGTLNNPSHLWFPTYSQFKSIIEASDFNIHGKVEYLHYYINKDNFVTNTIDYSKGYILRTPDHDERVSHPYRPMSLVIDLYKIEGKK